MTLRVYTDTGAVIRADVTDTMDAARMLQDLASNGVKCVKWYVER